MAGFMAAGSTVAASMVGFTADSIAALASAAPAGAGERSLRLGLVGLGLARRRVGLGSWLGLGPRLGRWLGLGPRLGLGLALGATLPPAPPALRIIAIDPSAREWPCRTWHVEAIWGKKGADVGLALGRKQRGVNTNG